MPDLATALQQVLRQVREETKHTESCANARHYGRDCYCGQPERVEAEQARRWKESILATTTLYAGTDPMILSDRALTAAQRERP